MANQRSEDKVRLDVYLSSARIQKLERLCAALKISKTDLVGTLVDMAVEVLVRTQLSRTRKT